ncbi:MAG TPA: GIY-YIG nuclease family protein [Sphingobacteriaceae bacterium]
MYVYALISDVDGRIYVGMAEDVALRLKQHNYGMSQSTRPYRPWKLLYQEECKDRKAARKRELQLKSGYGKEFLKSLLQ